MAKLDSKERKALPKEDFALPGRRYPINDPNHARNALARVSQHGDSQEKSEVRKKVHEKYPSIGAGSEKGAEGATKETYMGKMLKGALSRKK